MKTRITILCENTVLPQMGVMGEHGFSCFLETGHGNYLFDTGQGLGILNNSRIMEKDLRGLKGIVLSHGHYDHTGGLPEVLHQSGPVDVFAHPHVFLKRFRLVGKLKRFIGLPYHRSYLESLGARFRLQTEWTEIASGIYITGEVPRVSDFERGDKEMTAILDNGEEIHPDPFLDDLSLVVDSDRGLIVLLGCAHAGLVNILRYIMERTGRDRVHAVLGGTHLAFADETQMERTLQSLDGLRVERFGASHCTGLPQALRMQKHLGERFFFGSVGTVLEA